MATTPNPVTEMSSLDYCSNMMNTELALHLSVIPAILIILLLSSLERRRFKGSYCNGRFGLVVPLNFMDGHRHRWSYTVAAVAVSAEVVPILYRIYASKYPLWAKVFMVYLQALEVAIQGFPLFACIGTRFRLIGGICNFLYIPLMIGIDAATTVQVSCRLMRNVPTANQSSIIAGMVVAYLPYILALLFLFIQSVKKIVKCILTNKIIEDEDIKGVSTEDHHKLYLKVSLRKLPCTNSGESGWKFWQYRSMPGFLYPTRILCIIAMVLSIMWSIAAIFHVTMMPNLVQRIQTYEKRIEETECATHFVECMKYHLYIILLRIFTVATYVAMVMALVTVTLNMLLFLRNYRRSIFRLFKGDRSFILTRQQTSQMYMAQSMRFAGYFIAYNLWGFIVIYTIVMLLCICDGLAIEYLSLTDTVGSLFLRILEISLFPLTAMFLFYAQTILARQFLLQTRLRQGDKDPPLAVDNRKFYSVLSYYLLFINVAVGIISSIARTASSFILTIFQIGRLDKNHFQSGWHEKDRGYASYVGMLYVDYTHNHPALRVFCSLLWKQVLQHRHTPIRVISPDYVNVGNIQEHSPSGMTARNARSHVYVNESRSRGAAIRESSKRRVSNRWQLAYTLLRNPSLVSERRPNPPVPEKTRVVEQHQQPQSVTSRCLGCMPIVVYKISVASPLIIIGIMVAIPVLTLLKQFL